MRNEMLCSRRHARDNVELFHPELIGMVELNGVAITDEPLTSYLAEAECVHFSWSVEEHWKLTVHETYRDSQGKPQTRTRTESGWTTVASGGKTILFRLQYDYGEILIHPEGADLQTATIFSEICIPLEGLYFEKGPDTALPHSTHSRRFRENAIWAPPRRLSAG